MTILLLRSHIQRPVVFVLPKIPTQLVNETTPLSSVRLIFFIPKGGPVPEVLVRSCLSVCPRTQDSSFGYFQLIFFCSLCNNNNNMIYYNHYYNYLYNLLIIFMQLFTECLQKKLNRVVRKSCPNCVENNVSQLTFKKLCNKLTEIISNLVKQF